MLVTTGRQLCCLRFPRAQFMPNLAACCLHFVLTYGQTTTGWDQVLHRGEFWQSFHLLAVAQRRIRQSLPRDHTCMLGRKAVFCSINLMIYDFQTTAAGKFRSFWGAQLCNGLNNTALWFPRKPCRCSVSSAFKEMSENLCPAEAKGSTHTPP